MDCEPNVAVVADRALLEQAIVNLGHNALKHARGDVAFGATSVNRVVRITVRDDGAGIADDQRERIFERFYRADGEAFTGFGLGLAIVSEAVAALDGELGFETSPEGTTFAITLPSVRIIEP